MAIFQLRARNAKTNAPIKAEITLAGRNRGFTPDKKDTYLTVETAQSGKFSWYAKYNGKKIGEGESSGGKIEIYYS